MQARVLKVPGKVIPLELDEGASVADAIRESGVDTEGCSITIGGADVPMEHLLQDGDIVMVANQRIRGA